MSDEINPLNALPTRSTPVLADGPVATPQTEPQVDSTSEGPRVELPSTEQEAEVRSAEAAVEPEVFRPLASIGWSLAFGGAGAFMWALVTYVTEYELGLFAVVLGVMAGFGAAKGGRSPQAQIVGAVSAFVCYFLAQIMAIFMFVMFADVPQETEAPALVAEGGQDATIANADVASVDAPPPPAAVSPLEAPPVGLLELLGLALFSLVKETLTSLGVVFLGIAIWEGYRIPRPA